MPEVLANPTDTAICRLLDAGPVPTVTLATGLGVAERTVRHRLYRLRQVGAVVSGTDGLHHLAAPVAAAPIAGPLPALAAPVAAPGQPASDGPSPRHGGHWGARTVLAAAALGLAVVGGLAVALVSRRTPSPPPLPPARPTGFGDAGDPWGWMRGPTW